MLTEEQGRGLNTLTRKIHSGAPVTILQGPAGSGKSFLLNYLLQELGYGSKEVAYVSFTGTAAQVLKKQGLPATTIHSLIYKPIMRYGVCVGFRKQARAELGGLKLIIVDEFSMLSKEILRDLESYGIQLLLVGDQFQLPPIGEPNRFLNSADVFLNEVHRQALDNPLLWAATEIRLGRGLPAGIYGDTLWIGRKEKADGSWYRKDVQIITGLNRTKDELNFEMAGTRIPTVGHKIIFLKNDMNNGITNGSIGVITKINRGVRNKYRMDVDLGDGHSVEDYPAEFLLNGDTPERRGQFFSYAYAISCHKAQGQTFDSPGIVYDESHIFRNDSKKWLYVALTRYTGNYNVAVLR